MDRARGSRSARGAFPRFRTGKKGGAAARISMINVTKPADNEVRGRRTAPRILNHKIKPGFPPSRFDAIAYAAVLEVLG